MPSAAYEQVVSMLRAMPRIPLTAAAVPFVRAALDGMPTHAPTGVTATHVRIGDLDAEWLVHRDGDPRRRVLYLHGGAYFAGGRASHRALAGRIARASGAAALLVEYRLAPEHRFPAAVHDAVSAYRFLAENGPDGPSAAEHVFVAGDSAGGGLSLAVSLALRDAGARPPDGVVTLAAWTDLTASSASLTTRAASDPMLDGAQMPTAAALYLGDAPPTSPLASPLFGDLVGLPPLLMQVGDREVLYDDTVRFAGKARLAGVDVEVDVGLDMFHVYQIFSIPEGRDAIARIGAWLRRRMHRA